MLWWLPLAAFIVALLILRLLLFRFGRFALDRPNQRSLHATPVPRTGGIAILAGMAVALPFAGAELWLPLLLALLLAGVSLFDDLEDLPTRLRLAVHFAAVGVLVWYVLSPMAIAEIIVLVLAVVWITNLYNFMDGADGVAGGMAVIGFATYAVAGWLAGHEALALTCAALSAASLAFLFHNFHPAKIFLGDVGSIPLGFLVGALGIIGWRDDVWPLWFPLLAFGPFMGDATITLVKRLVRRERVWYPHRDHYYQRIVRMGLGHRSAALIGYAIMVFCAAAALFGRSRSPALQAVAFAGATLVLAAMALWVDRRWAQIEKKQ